MQNINWIEVLPSGATETDNVRMPKWENVAEWLTTIATNFDPLVFVGLDDELIDGVPCSSRDLGKVLTEFKWDRRLLDVAVVTALVGERDDVIFGEILVMRLNADNNIMGVEDCDRVDFRSMEFVLQILAALEVVEVVRIILMNLTNLVRALHHMRQSVVVETVLVMVVLLLVMMLIVLVMLMIVVVLIL